MQNLDDADRRILRQFQADPTLSTAELAARANVTPATCWRRLEKLERAGVIEAVEAVIDWRVLGYAVEVSLRVTLDKTVRGAFEDFLAAARDLPEVNEIQTFLGRTDVRLNVLARDMRHYQEIYRSRILALPHMADIEALMLVATVQDSEALPL